MGNGVGKIPEQKFDQKNASYLGEFSFLSEKSNLSIENISIKQKDTLFSSSDNLNNNQSSSSNNKIEFYQNNINTKCFIYLSYCWFDEEQSHQIVEKLSQLGLNVTMDQEKISTDTLNDIYNSDMIVICISKSYLSCNACLREAYLSFNQNVPIIPILLTTNYKPDAWLAQIIAGKKYKLITENSKRYDYNKSKDFIFKTIQIWNDKLIDKKQPFVKKKKFNYRELAKLRENYRIKFQNQILKEKNLIEENRQYILKVFADLIQNEAEFGKQFSCIYRWLKKYPNVTFSNFAPFTPTGDINDATFIPEEGISKNQSFHSQSKMNSCLASKINQLDNFINSVTYDMTENIFIKFENKPWNFDTNLVNGNVAWKTIENKDFNNQPARSIKEIKRRKMLDLNLKLGKKRRLELSKYFKCKSDTFCKFAEKMLDNLTKFEEFCKNFNQSYNKSIDENKISFQFKSIHHNDDKKITPKDKNSQVEEFNSKTVLCENEKNQSKNFENEMKKSSELIQNKVIKKHPLSEYEPVFFKIDFYYKY